MRSSAGSTTNASPPVAAPLTTLAEILSSLVVSIRRTPEAGTESNRTVKIAFVGMKETEPPDDDCGELHGAGRDTDCVAIGASTNDRSHRRTGLAAAAAVSATIAAAATQRGRGQRPEGVDTRSRRATAREARRRRNRSSSTRGTEIADSSSRTNASYSLKRSRRSRHAPHSSRCRRADSASVPCSPSMSARISPSARCGGMGCSFTTPRD